MFILRKDFNTENSRDVSLIKFRFEEYKKYLNSISDKLPQSAKEFALADWRLDFTDHRCPHDSWVEDLKISEKSNEEDRRNRKLEIEIRLLGAYHDGFLQLKYLNVKRYSLNKQTSWESHCDGSYDEVRLSETDLVLHEIEFAGGENWIIECEDIEFSWVQLKK